MLSIEPATREDLKEFYPKSIPSMRAIVGKKDGKVVGVSGYYIKNETVIVFSDMSEELRQEKSFKRVMIKAYRIIISMIENTNLPVISVACESIPGSNILLEHMGFKPLIRNVYIWPR